MKILLCKILQKGSVSADRHPFCIYPLNRHHILDNLPAYAKESHKVSEQVGSEYFEGIHSTDFQTSIKTKEIPTSSVTW